MGCQGLLVAELGFVDCTAHFGEFRCGQGLGPLDFGVNGTRDAFKSQGRIRSTTR